MRKIVVNIARVVLGLTFILSGFVKAVDPLGTKYKLADYAEALHIEQITPDFVTMGASILLSAFEFMLGICLLLAMRRRAASRLVLLMMVVMTPLTLWLAIANPVSDCGCFGDALVLTNWQTFWKNVVLLVLAVVVWKWPLDMVRIITKSNQWIVINYTALFILALSGWSLYDLPYFDFRPYHIGANIREGMEIPEGAAQPQFETTFILEKDGRQETFTAENYPDSTWRFIDSKTVQLSEGYQPPIHDFSLMRLSDGADITDSLLSVQGYVFLLASPQLQDADDGELDRINELYEYAEDHGYPFYCMTASNQQGINGWIERTGAAYPFCQTDETTLKTVIRSNPGLVLLKRGIIIGKWSHNRLPVIDETETSKPLEQLSIGKTPEDSVPGKILIILLWYVLPLVLLIIADMLWAWTTRIRNEK